ncbi:MAG TPA: DUF1508 domain-containing protein [Sulfurovum sp.]|nr:DUF1508 domain-containing protein [Sulfurovum sp.]
MSARYVLYKHDRNTQPYHWVLKAPNGETILTSETYVSEAGALNGIRSAQVNCKADANYKRLTARNGSPYFTLNSPDNGQVIGVSEMYSTTQARDNGIESVKVNGTTSTIVRG